MTSVYTLHHVYVRVSGVQDEKMIGVYASREEPERLVPQYRMLPGFSKHPDKFRIDEYVIDRDSWAEGFVPGEGKQPGGRL